jgi:hypothetical protein
MIMLCGLVASTSLGSADEIRPSPDAKLLMARFATGGMVATFAPQGTILQSVPDIAIYSDGTVLTADEQEMLLPLNLHVAVIPADIAHARFKKFYEGLAGAALRYPQNCWSTLSDGTRHRYDCVTDVHTANIVLWVPEDQSYRSIAVDAGYYWRRVEEMRGFVPSTFFDLMAWMNGLRDLPSKPWQVSSDVVPGFSPGDPACQVAQELCR